MPTPDFTGAQVAATVRSLLNDQIGAVYTDAVQLPYLNSALNELQELFELNNVPVTNDTSVEIEIPAASVPGVVTVGFTTVPPLPSDLIEIQQLWERTTGTNQWVPMTKMDFLPHYLEGILVQSFQFWAWEKQLIKLMACSLATDLKIDYIRQLFTPVTDINQNIGIINGKSFLDFRVAALCAQFIGENKTRADELNVYASLAMDRVLGIGAKTRQAITTRRRPFRASFKSRNNW